MPRFSLSPFASASVSFLGMVFWSPSRDPLSALMARAQGGDVQAFGALYEALYPRVWSFVWQRTRHREDAEDVVSKTFHRLLEHLDAYDPARGSVAAYALSIARNLLIDDARSRRPTVSADADDVTPLEPRTPFLDVARDQETRILLACVEQLAPPLREVLLLRLADGLRHAEIAALLGISEAAVKQRASRALREIEGALRRGRKKEAVTS